MVVALQYILKLLLQGHLRDHIIFAASVYKKSHPIFDVRDTTTSTSALALAV